MAPEATGVSSSTVRVRLAAGILALNRFMMTLQNKRMPVADVKVDAGARGTGIKLGFDCPEETARRYAVLLENMEDVEELHFAGPAPHSRKESPVGYEGRRFRSVENSETGEVGPETGFNYGQAREGASRTHRGETERRT